VLNLDRSFAPRSWWMTAEVVVEASLRGLERDICLVIPGWRYKLVVLAVKTMPRRLLDVLAPKGTQHRDRYVKAQP